MVVAAALALFASFAATGCQSPTAGSPSPADKPLAVVATTTLVGDVVSEIGGDLIELTVLFPTGSDPHRFDATPHDAAALAEADLVFINGLGLEESLMPLLESATQGSQVVSVSADIVPLTTASHDEHHGHVEEPDDHADGDGQEQGEAVDPHVWTDPTNVRIWADTIADAMSEADPANEAHYQEAALHYKGQLDELDDWIREQVSAVPVGDRLLVTDHDTLSYFAARYGFKEVGSIIPGLSTLAEPTARDMADLLDILAALDIPAVFVGTAVEPTVAEQIAADCGAKVVPIYTASLSAPGGPADSYVRLMEYNVTAIVDALAQPDV
jgi:ABC-type Zn uptake system ZnuABC Zn-binding protein ZnuA